MVVQGQTLEVQTIMELLGLEVVEVAFGLGITPTAMQIVSLKVVLEVVVVVLESVTLLKVVGDTLLQQVVLQILVVVVEVVFTRKLLVLVGLELL